MILGVFTFITEFFVQKKLTLYVGGTRLNRKQTTFTSACPTHKQMNGKHQNEFRFFLPTGSPLKKGETTPSSRGQLSSKKVRPSLDLLSQLLKLLTLRSYFEASACRSHSLFFFVFQPVHGKSKACLAVAAGLVHFLAQRIQGNVAAQGHPRKIPIRQETGHLFT